VLAHVRRGVPGLTAARAVAVLDQLVAVTDDAALGQEVIKLRHDVERVLEFRAAETAVPLGRRVLATESKMQRITDHHLQAA